MQRRIQQAVEELDETVREIRTSIFDLHTTADRAGGGCAGASSTPRPKPQKAPG
jgi:signal transduction histidine kinase